MDDKTLVATLVPSTVQDISYGQDVHRRVGAAIELAVISFGIGGLMALTKSKKHYVGLTWPPGRSNGKLKFTSIRSFCRVCLGEARYRLLCIASYTE